MKYIHVWKTHSSDSFNLQVFTLRRTQHSRLLQFKWALIVLTHGIARELLKELRRDLPISIDTLWRVDSKVSSAFRRREQANEVWNDCTKREDRVEQMNLNNGLPSVVVCSFSQLNELSQEVIEIRSPCPFFPLPDFCCCCCWPAMGVSLRWRSVSTWFSSVLCS